MLTDKLAKTATVIFLYSWKSFLRLDIDSTTFLSDTRIIICSDELISSTFYKMATALINLSRLYPVATENARMLQEDIVIQGYRIPPNVSQYHCYKEYN